MDIFKKINEEFERLLFRFVKKFIKRIKPEQLKEIIEDIKQNCYPNTIPKTTIIGQKVLICNTAQICDFCKIGDRSAVMDGTTVGEGSVIGKFCCIGRNVVIGPNQHPQNFLSTHTFQYGNEYNNFNVIDFKSQIPTIIGNDVWIGTNVILMGGITVGDGSIIGAGAVVTRNVEPYSIVVGVPAKIIKYRFSKDIIDKLLELKWWDIEEIYLKDLPFDNIEDCIKRLCEIKQKLKEYT